jgi:hypothetical protein
MMVLAVSSAGTRAEVAFVDTTFAPAGWFVESVPGWPGQWQSNEGTSFTASQALTGGSGGAYRFMTHYVPAGRSIAVAYINLSATYNPAVHGAISEIDYREDFIEINPPFVGAEIGVGFLLRQDGEYFSAGYAALGQTTWTPYEITGLTAADFLSSSGAHPNFSASAAPIHLGYLRSNSATPGYPPFLTEHGIDNWIVTVTPVAETVPPPPGPIDPQDPPSHASQYNFVIGAQPYFQWHGITVGLDFSLSVPTMDPIQYNPSITYPEESISPALDPWETEFHTNNRILGALLSAAAPIEFKPHRQTGCDR